MVKRKRSGNDARSGSKRRRNDSLRKLKHRRRKRVKRMSKRSTKQIKKVVKKVLECGENVGLYTKDYAAQFSIVNYDTANNQIVFDALQIDDANSLNNYLEEPTNEALKLSPFSGRKLLDAVSILYNQKPKGLNYAANRVSANDALDPSVFNFSVKDLKVDFLYCSYELNLFNNSFQIYDIDIYFGRPKNSINDSLQGRWSALIGNVAWLTSTPTINTINATPGQIPALKQEYTFRKASFRMAPGDKRKFFTKFKGCVEFGKHLRNDGVLQNYMKGVTQSWMIVAKPALASTASGGSVTVGRQTKRNEKPYCITAEVKEVYKVMEPDGTDDTAQGNHREYYVNYPVESTENAAHFVVDRSLFSTAAFNGGP